MGSVIENAEKIEQIKIDYSDHSCLFFKKGDRVCGTRFSGEIVIAPEYQG